MEYSDDRDGVVAKAAVENMTAGGIFHEAFPNIVCAACKPRIPRKKEKSITDGCDVCVGTIFSPMFRRIEPDLIEVAARRLRIEYP